MIIPLLFFIFFFIDSELVTHIEWINVFREHHGTSYF